MTPTRTPKPSPAPHEPCANKVERHGLELVGRCRRRDGHAGRCSFRYERAPRPQPDELSRAAKAWWEIPKGDRAFVHRILAKEYGKHGNRECSGCSALQMAARLLRAAERSGKGVRGERM